MAEERENPRTRRVRRLILDTAVEVLLECGAHDVTASVVAERADVARTTIYRHWPDQLSLLLATVMTLTDSEHISALEGPLAESVPLELERLRMRLVTRDVRSVFGALASYAVQHEAFEDAQRLFVRQLAQPLVLTLEAARARGELSSEVDCEFEATQLAAPILHQHLVLHEEIADSLIAEVSRRWFLNT